MISAIAVMAISHRFEPRQAGDVRTFGEPAMGSSSQKKSLGNGANTIGVPSISDKFGNSPRGQ